MFLFLSQFFAKVLCHTESDGFARWIPDCGLWFNNLVQNFPKVLFDIHVATVVSNIFISSIVKVEKKYKIFKKLELLGIFKDHRNYWNYW